jgi:TRL-like protein family
MVKRLCVLALLLGVVAVTGCIWPRYGVLMAPIMTTRSPVPTFVNNDVAPTKMGEATAQGIILITQGDASIAAAMKDGGITKVNHIDTEELYVLGVYAKETIRVYGE